MNTASRIIISFAVCIEIWLLLDLNRTPPVIHFFDLKKFLFLTAVNVLTVLAMICTWTSHQKTGAKLVMTIALAVQSVLLFDWGSTWTAISPFDGELSAHYWSGFFDILGSDPDDSFWAGVNAYSEIRGTGIRSVVGVNSDLFFYTLINVAVAYVFFRVWK